MKNLTISILVLFFLVGSACASAQTAIGLGLVRGKTPVVNVQVPQQPAPVVNVQSATPTVEVKPEINVQPTPVNIQPVPPAINVQAAKPHVNIKNEVQIPSEVGQVLKDLNDARKTAEAKALPNTVQSSLNAYTSSLSRKEVSLDVTSGGDHVLIRSTAPGFFDGPGPFWTVLLLVVGSVLVALLLLHRPAAPVTNITNNYGDRRRDGDRRRPEPAPPVAPVAPVQPAPAAPMPIVIEHRFPRLGVDLAGDLNLHHHGQQQPRPRQQGGGGRGERETRWVPARRPEQAGQEILHERFGGRGRWRAVHPITLRPAQPPANPPAQA